MSNETSDAAREWRELILKKIDHLESTQVAIQKDISEIKINSTSPQTIEKILNRLNQLELFRERAMTLFFVIQFLTGVGMMIVNRIWK